MFRTCIVTEYWKVEGHSSLARDSESTAVVNTDINAYRAQKLRKETFKRQVEEINNLKKDVSDIKTLLTQLVDKIHG